MKKVAFTCKLQDCFLANSISYKVRQPDKNVSVQIYCCYEEKTVNCREDSTRELILNIGFYSWTSLVTGLSILDSICEFTSKCTVVETTGALWPYLKTRTRGNKSSR